MSKDGEEAMRLVRVHRVRAGDALQLAAALVWADGQPTTREFVTLVQRLGAVARLEGFVVLPE